MKKETTEIVKMLVIGLLVMLALPLAYRVWVYYHPQPERKSLTAMLLESNEARREALLMTPFDKWSESDAKLAPDVHDWLEAHGSVILPWEWTEEARKKDWNGYCDTWDKLIAEQLSAIRKIISRKDKISESAKKDAAIEREMYSHLTNDAVVLSKAVAVAGSFPCKVEIEEMTPGRFWGWNRKNTIKEFDSEGSMLSFAEELKKSAIEHMAKAESLDRAAEVIATELIELKATESDLVAVQASMTAARKTDPVKANVAAEGRKSLLKSIRTEFKYRESVRRKLPTWVPDRVKKWLGVRNALQESSNT